jgi:hypothetical protein
MSLQQSDHEVDPPGVVLSENPRPEHPRPSMTFKQQADLLEYLHGRFTQDGSTGRWTICIDLADQPLMDDLWLTAQRLRRMDGHDRQVRELVTGK